MKQLPSCGDRRAMAFCAFCGGDTATRDHCPSRVFLDSPYPENLPVVPACSTCNNSFSEDEEYLACLISCVLAGSTEPDVLPREKIRNILSRKPALRARIEQSRSVSGGETTFCPEHDRILAVITKLAQGHALHELHESVARPPDNIEYVSLSLMTDAQRVSFENAESCEVFPEVGSCAMQRLIVGADLSPGEWLVVQPERYRYRAFLGNSIEVRIVLHEYLACRVCWEHQSML
jgi:hypothetical protein